MQHTVGMYFKKLRILHIGVCITLAFVLFLFRYLVKNNMDGIPNKNIFIEILGIAIGFIGILGARFLFFFKTQAATSIRMLGGKLKIFEEAFVFQIAILSGVASINAILYLTTRYDLYFFIALGALLLLAFRRPTRAIAAMVLFTNTENRQPIYVDSTPI
ncbi:MAG TPA: hypothetical protein PLK15_01830 [Chitinophagales bacterium]|nr:hypothetical protein [Chitinophagales bacterium]